MKSGSGSRRGAFALIAFTLGGSVMLMASRPHGSAVRAASGTPMSARTTQCRVFWAGDRDLNGQGAGQETGGIHVFFYRNRRYNSGTMDLSKGEMIGGIENATPATSRIYPRLGAGSSTGSGTATGSGKACIFFSYDATNDSAAAEFHPYDAAAAKSKLDSALYCRNHPGSIPEWSEIPADCTTVSLTMGGVSVKLTVAKGAKFVGNVSVTTQLQKKFKPGDIPTILKALTAEGAWFPCESNGCCRAF